MMSPPPTIIRVSLLHDEVPFDHQNQCKSIPVRAFQPAPTWPRGFSHLLYRVCKREAVAPVAQVVEDTLARQVVAVEGILVRLVVVAVDMEVAGREVAGRQFQEVVNGGGQGFSHEVHMVHSSCSLDVVLVSTVNEKLNWNAKRWHPDRCSASGNSKFIEEAKKKFQGIQHAYYVLSDANKRFLYDVGVYDSDDDDDENGMGDFLNEMANMMSQTKTNEKNGEESFEKLQELFEEMFHGDGEALGSSSQMNLEGSSSFDAHFQSFCLGKGGTPAQFQEGEGSRRTSQRNRR
ncbi:hypothetical protein LWI29_036364 [Acer saccharum]|uniref:J domain-containing protein n=1 Tax=Acer saccharum TaxID=4024 RepID=A0AA39SZT6_ACESA|nr:hypothetical protein LWI29_036364 [Acer saccharum]